mgnify:CR=1 FL=1
MYKPLGRRFYLNRKEDPSGISGVGIVGEGWLDPLGEAILVWLVGEHKSTEIHHSIEDLLAIHGHSGATEVVWIDAEPTR